MSTAIKWVLVLVVVAGAGWLVWQSGWLSSVPQQAPITATTTPPVVNTNGMSPAEDTSDAGLMQDAAAVDAQMKALEGDAVNVESSLNDKPGSQDY